MSKIIYPADINKKYNFVGIYLGADNKIDFIIECDVISPDDVNGNFKSPICKASYKFAYIDTDGIGVFEFQGYYESEAVYHHQRRDFYIINERFQNNFYLEAKKDVNIYKKFPFLK